MEKKTYLMRTFCILQKQHAHYKAGLEYSHERARRRCMSRWWPHHTVMAKLSLFLSSVTFSNATRVHNLSLPPLLVFVSLVNYYINISLNLGYPYISTDKDLLCPVFTSDSTDINTPAESCKKMHFQWLCLATSSYSADDSETRVVCRA